MHDIAIIGGGINGCGIARDAVGRGYSVLLVEKDDLASGTSSGSTKLIHGGLRYLEHYEFRLVREALKEREVLLTIAPHIIWPMRFLLPYTRGMRPAWLIRLGLFLYDHLAKRELLPGSGTVDLAKAPTGKPLKPGFTTAFAYSDCWVDDARLVVLNARDAADRGAEIKTRTECVRAERQQDHWVLTLKDHGTGDISQMQARMLINAAGPWIDNVLGTVLGRNDNHNVRLVQGSHIVVPRLFDHDQAYIFQNDDGRVLFAIPYEDDFTLIGTTDREYEGDLDTVAISQSEIDYICKVASSYFRQPILPDSVVWHYSALRPLYDDGAERAQEATRDYVLTVEGSPGTAALVNIFGGKITTYRRLAESVLDKVDATFARSTRSWTAATALPGGELPTPDNVAFADQLQQTYPFLATEAATRYARSYGTLAHEFLEGAKSNDDLGRNFGGGLTEREVQYLRAREWAETIDDILWRRSKLGLRLTESQARDLQQWLIDHPAITKPA